jgi:hypothetical protein
LERICNPLPSGLQILKNILIEDLYIHMLYNTVGICSSSICCLPADRIDRTGSDRVIDIFSLVVPEWLDTRESLIIEREYITRDRRTRTTTDTGRVDMRFSECSFEGSGLDIREHRWKVKSEKLKVESFGKWIFFTEV